MTSIAKSLKTLSALAAIGLLSSSVIAQQAPAQPAPAAGNNANAGAAAAANLNDQLSVKLKDIVTFGNSAGVPVQGVGLVYGLVGTGDGADEATRKMAMAVQRRLLQDDELVDDRLFESENTARVMLTGSIPTGKTVAGSTFTLNVALFGNNAESLVGGILGYADFGIPGRADDTAFEVLGWAEGALQVSQGPNGSITRGMVVATLGTDLDVELYQTEFDDKTGLERRMMTLAVNSPDDTTARSIARAINSDRSIIGAITAGLAEQDRARVQDIAKAINSGRVDIEVPKAFWGDEVEFRSTIGEISVTTGTQAKVSVNTSSNTIVVSGGVKVARGQINVGGISFSFGGENGSSTDLAALMNTMSQINLSQQQQVEVVLQLNRDGLIQGKVTVE